MDVGGVGFTTFKDAVHVLPLMISGWLLAHTLYYYAITIAFCEICEDQAREKIRQIRQILQFHSAFYVVVAQSLFCGGSGGGGRLP